MLNKIKEKNNKISLLLKDFFLIDYKAIDY